MMAVVNCDLLSTVTKQTIYAIGIVCECLEIIMIAWEELKKQNLGISWTNKKKKKQYWLILTQKMIFSLSPTNAMVMDKCLNL